MKLKNVIKIFFLIHCCYSATVDCDPRSQGKNERCLYVRTSSDCVSNGFLNLLEINYCAFEDHSWLGVGFICVALGYCFIVLGLIAEQYLAPTLEVLSIQLNLSQNVAGVTLLAFGNGAPDLFSNIRALTTDGPSLGISGLVGSGTFVMAFVAGTVIIVAEGALVDRIPVIRDTVFSCFMIIFLEICFFDNKVYMSEAIVSLMLYFLYVVVVFLSDKKGKPFTDEDKFPPLTGSNRNPRSNTANEITLESNQTSKYGAANFIPDTAQIRSGSDRFQSSEDSIVQLILSDFLKPVRKQSNKYNCNGPTTQSLKGQPSSHSEFRSLISQQQGLGGEETIVGVTFSPKMCQTFTNAASPSQDFPAISISETHLRPEASVLKLVSEVPEKTLFNTPVACENKNLGLSVPDSSRLPNRLCKSMPLNASNPRSKLREIYSIDWVSVGRKDRKSTNLGFQIPRDYYRPSIGTEISFFVSGGRTKFRSTVMARNLSRVFLGMNSPRLNVSRASSTISGFTVKVEDKTWWKRGVTGTKNFFFTVIWLPILIAEVVLWMTIPKVDMVKDWNPYLAVFAAFASPIIIFLVIFDWAMELPVGVPLVLYPAAGGMLIALFLWFHIFSRPKVDQALPIFPYFFSILAFVASIVWINALAKQIINLLEALGIISGIEPALMGLTLLTWGNSVGDLMANLAVAKAGYPKTAVGASIAAPLLNILIGFGIGMGINISGTPNKMMEFYFGPTLEITAHYLVFICTIHLAFLWWNGFKLQRYHGFALIFSYIVYLVIVILIANDILIF